ncbi:MAG: hypothetical protein LUG57_02575 [Oscillospiraceae bacterium]|nr:hypothetical protein [Oscillospiraceae bacterium]
MSYRELAQTIIDQLPEDKMIFVVNILASLGEMSGVDVYAQLPPNSETMRAIEEVDDMIKTGEGQHFEGSTADFFAAWMEED